MNQGLTHAQLSVALNFDCTWGMDNNSQSQDEKEDGGDTSGLPGPCKQAKIYFVCQAVEKAPTTTAVNSPSTSSASASSGRDESSCVCDETSSDGDDEHHRNNTRDNPVHLVPYQPQWKEFSPRRLVHRLGASNDTDSKKVG